MAKTPAPVAGTMIMGKYRVERELGSGGMSTVVEATHVALDQRVAVKILDPELARSPEIVTRFFREARIAAALPPDHIARATDYGQTEAGVPYLVMELLAGHDFAVELERAGQLAISAAVDFVLEACQGVADAHAVGLVHRDLKPANLFLARRPGRAPVVKVLDFGLSKEPPSQQQVALTQTETVFGTPQYMSPEQVLSAKNVDARSDQHALAMILFEALTGRPPFQGTTVNQLVVAIAVQPPPRARELRADVPPKLDAALQRAMAKKPGDRFASIAGFARAIAPFGGPLASAMALRTEAILGPTAEAEPGPRGGPAGAGSDAHVTLPLGVAVGNRAPAPSQTDFTSSVDPLKQGRRAKRIAISAAAVALVGGITLGFLLSRTGAPAADRGVVATGPASASIPPPEPTPAITVSPAPADATTPPPASATASAAKKTKIPAPKPTSPQPAVSRAIGVFGERTK